MPIIGSPTANLQIGGSYKFNGKDSVIDLGFGNNFRHVYPDNSYWSSSSSPNQQNPYKMFDFNWGSFAMEAWIKTDYLNNPAANESMQTILSVGSWHYTDGNFMFGLLVDGTLGATMAHAYPYQISMIRGGPPLTDGKWHHVIWTQDRRNGNGLYKQNMDSYGHYLQTSTVGSIYGAVGGSITDLAAHKNKLYIDGERVQPELKANTYDAYNDTGWAVSQYTAPIHRCSAMIQRAGIGGRNYASAWTPEVAFTGEIGLIRTWNRLLTDDDVIDLYSGKDIEHKDRMGLLGTTNQGESVDSQKDPKTNLHYIQWPTAEKTAVTVLNPDFTDTSNWTTQTGWSISGGKAVFDYSGNAQTGCNIYQGGLLVVGQAYRIKFVISDLNDGNNGFFYVSSTHNGTVAAANYAKDNGLTFTADGTYYYEFIAGVDYLNLGAETTGVPQFTCKIDSIVLEELQGITGSKTGSHDDWKIYAQANQAMELTNEKFNGIYGDLTGLAIKVSNAAHWAGIYSPGWRQVPGKRYRVSMWVWNDQASGGDIKCTLYASGTPDYLDDPTSIYSEREWTTVSKDVHVNKEWVYLEHEYTATFPDVDDNYVIIHTSFGDTTFFVDDFRVEQVGCISEFLPSGVSEDFWVDSSGHNTWAKVSSWTVANNFEKGHIQLSNIKTTGMQFQGEPAPSGSTNLGRWGTKTTLDAYEEGEFTAIFNVSYDSTPDGSTTQSFNISGCSYQRVGNTCKITIPLIMADNIGNGTTPLNIVSITGMPFVAKHNMALSIGEPRNGSMRGYLGHVTFAALGCNIAIFADSSRLEPHFTEAGDTHRGHLCFESYSGSYIDGISGTYIIKE